MHTRSQTGEMPASNAQRFDDLESKLDKLLELQTATNTLMSSLTTSLDHSTNKQKSHGQSYSGSSTFKQNYRSREPSKHAKQADLTEQTVSTGLFLTSLHNYGRNHYLLAFERKTARVKHYNKNETPGGFVSHDSR